MISHVQQGLEKDEVARLRQEGGRWLRLQRERVGLTQRELAHALGAEYYSFISQLEAGKGRVPIAQMDLWASALKMSRHDFAKGILRYYDPVTFDMLFGDAERSAAEAAAPEPAKPEPAKPEPVKTDEGHDGLLARLNRLEALLMLKGLEK